MRIALVFLALSSILGYIWIKTLPLNFVNAVVTIFLATAIVGCLAAFVLLI